MPNPAPFCSWLIEGSVLISSYLDAEVLTVSWRAWLPCPSYARRGGGGVTSRFRAVSCDCSKVSRRLTKGFVSWGLFHKYQLPSPVHKCSTVQLAALQIFDAITAHDDTD